MNTDKTEQYRKEFELSVTGYNFEKYSQGTYVYRDTRVLWEVYLAGRKKGEEIIDKMQEGLDRSVETIAIERLKVDELKKQLEEMRNKDCEHLTVCKFELDKENLDLHKQIEEMKANHYATICGLSKSPYRLNSPASIEMLKMDIHQTYESQIHYLKSLLKQAVPWVNHLYYIPDSPDEAIRQWLWRVEGVK